MTTKKSDTPAAAPIGSDTAAEIVTTTPADIVTIPRGQLDQLLDNMNDLRDEIDALKAAQTGASADVVEQVDQTAAFDAELEALVEEFKDYPAVQQFQQRALVGLDANLDIRLKDDLSVIEDSTGENCKWKLRWFNFAKEGRAQQAEAEGYVKVRWDELSNREAITGGSNADAYVRKGDRGLEVLHKIPLKFYDYKKRRDAASRAGLLTSAKGVRDLLAERVSGMVGARGGNADQAGTFLGSKRVHMTVTPTKTERFTP